MSASGGKKKAPEDLGGQAKTFLGRREVESHMGLVQGANYSLKKAGQRRGEELFSKKLRPVGGLQPR